MKLLRDLIRLRAAGRRLLSVRRDSHTRHYAITVPQPLHRMAETARGHVPVTAGEHTAAKSMSSAALRLASS